MTVWTVACNIVWLYIEDKYHFMDLQLCVSWYNCFLVVYRMYNYLHSNNYNFCKIHGSYLNLDEIATVWWARLQKTGKIVWILASHGVRYWYVLYTPLKTYISLFCTFLVFVYTVILSR
jgi:hypothetical protein